MTWKGAVGRKFNCLCSGARFSVARNVNVFGFCRSAPGYLPLGAWPLEARMRRIVHISSGSHRNCFGLRKAHPSHSVRPGSGPRFLRAIHPGDLLGVMGSPAFGTRRHRASGGPGFEGAVLSANRARVDASLGLRPGLRVAFFPAPGSWRNEVLVSAGSVDAIA